MPNPTNNKGYLSILDMFADGDLFPPREVPLADRLFPVVPISQRSKVWRGGESFRTWSRRMDGKPREVPRGWGVHPDLAISEWPPAVLDLARWGLHPAETLHESPDCVGFSKPMVSIDFGKEVGFVMWDGVGRGLSKSEFGEFLRKMKDLGYDKKTDPADDIRRAKAEMLDREFREAFTPPPVTGYGALDDPPPADLFVRLPPEDPRHPGRPTFDAPNRKRFKRSQRKRR